jgi:spermidine synthase
LRYLLIAFVVAFCSMCYELVLAQTITLLYGSTLYNYTLIIGVFIFSLGMGAALHSRRAAPATARTFWLIEVVLSALGCGAPFVILGLGAATPGLTFDLLTPSAALMAACIGLLSGMEIPVLIDLAQAGRQPVGGGDSRIRNIIALDFIGTFAAAVLVPLVFFPFAGLIRTAVLTALLNALIALYYSLSGYDRARTAAWAAPALTGLVLLGIGLVLAGAGKLSGDIFSAVY